MPCWRWRGGHTVASRSCSQAGHGPVHAGCSWAQETSATSHLATRSCPKSLPAALKRKLVASSVMNLAEQFVEAPSTCPSAGQAARPARGGSAPCRRRAPPGSSPCCCSGHAAGTGTSVPQRLGPSCRSGLGSWNDQTWEHLCLAMN